MHNDNEIIKALVCCIHDDEGTKERPCQDCPLLRDDACSNSLRKHSLDLINRQKAEIEKLNVELVGMRGACESYKMHYNNAQAEIERLKARNDELNALNKSASIEAVKATILEIDNRLSHYGKCDELYKYEVTDVLVEVEEELTNVKEKSKTAILSLQEAGCRLSRDMAKSADEAFITLAKKEAIKEFADKFIKVLKDALYGLDIKEKTISKEEVRKRFESLLHKDIPEVIEYVKNKMVGDDNA